MSSTQELNEAQLSAARATAWRQAGDPVLTLEAARDWINERGLVLFAPRAAQLPVPAPSLVEATLGAANAAPTMAETETARGLVSRLVGEGLALPLNLLGVPGDSPDFVVSAQVFSYVFTMRGDKVWKQPPSTSGAVKVSPLGLRVFEVLTERGPMSAAELAQELGREVTETAILRSLSELWSQLRVLPLLQQGGGVTLWELTSRRFTKAIKAGANAGQPTALSALVSLYLAQVFAATEEEVATFLSPLTARSRVREVLHALVGARQLETVVVEGKTLLHIPGTLMVFAAADGGETPVAEGEEVAAERPKKIGTGRIKSFGGESSSGKGFESKGRKTGEFRGKPAGRGASAGRAGAGPVKPSARFGARLDGKTDRDRRPFKKDGAAAGRAAGASRPEKKSFTKPWNEERKVRPAEKADGFTKFRRPAPQDREPLGPREQAGLPEAQRSAPKSQRSAPKAGFDRASKPGGLAKRPYASRGAEGEDRGPFKARSYERPAGRSERPTRAGGDRPSKPGGFGAKRAYAPRASEGGERSYAKRPFNPRASERGASGFAKRPYAPKSTEGGDRASFKPRSFAASGEREARGREAKPGGFGAKRPYAPRSAEGGERPYAKRPYTPRADEGGASGFAKRSSSPESAMELNVERTLPKRPYKPRAADAHTRPFTKEPWSPPTENESAKRPYKPRAEGAFSRVGTGKSFGAKPGGKFGTRAGARPRAEFGGKPGGFGAKRSGPAGGRPAGRKRPEAGE